MRIILGAVIATSLLIFVGVLVISPVFYPADNSVPVMLSFNIHEQSNLPNWCEDLSAFLHSKNIKATIFITGELAEKYPTCITSFPKSFDVGSQTFSYVQLTEISDYSIQLEEVNKGKLAVDKAGNLDSKLFKAPYGITDDNIHSLLTRNSILADFSYPNQYNKYHNEQFLKFDLLTYDSQNNSIYSLQNIESNDIPVQIEFDTFMSTNEVTEIISEINSWNIKFVTASEISNMDLTKRN